MALHAGGFLRPADSMADFVAAGVEAGSGGGKRRGTSRGNRFPDRGGASAVVVWIVVATAEAAWRNCLTGTLNRGAFEFPRDRSGRRFPAGRRKFRPA